MKPKPIIGFIGMLLMLCGCAGYFAFDSGWLGLLMLLGVVVLIFALITGNVKTLG